MVSTNTKLAEAIELAEDAMAYVPEYFANKHGMLRRMAALKEVAAHEQAQAGEPVAPYLYVYEYDSPLGLHRALYPTQWNGQKPTRTVPLYTTPQPAQAELVGLTDEQIQAMRKAAAAPDDWPESWSYRMGVRDAERAHGIGATTGEQHG